MKLHFLIISLLVLLLGCTKTPYRHQRNVAARDLGIKKRHIEIVKVDSLFLQTQVPFIKDRLKRISEILKKFNIEDTVTIFNYYRYIGPLGDELSACYSTLLGYRAADSSETAIQRIFNKKEATDSSFNDYCETYNIIRKYFKTIGFDFFLQDQDDLKRENLFFIKDLVNNESYIFDFDIKGKVIEGKIKLSEQIP